MSVDTLGIRDTRDPEGLAGQADERERALGVEAAGVALAVVAGDERRRGACPFPGMPPGASSRLGDVRRRNRNHHDGAGHHALARGLFRARLSEGGRP